MEEALERIKEAIDREAGPLTLDDYIELLGELADHVTMLRDAALDDRGA